MKPHQRSAIALLKHYLRLVQAPPISGMAHELYRASATLGDSFFQQRQGHFFTLFLFLGKFWKLAIYNTSKLDSMNANCQAVTPYV